MLTKRSKRTICIDADVGIVNDNLGRSLSTQSWPEGMREEEEATERDWESFMLPARLLRVRKI